MKLTIFDLPTFDNRLMTYLESGNIEYIILTLATAWGKDAEVVEKTYNITCNRITRRINFNTSKGSDLVDLIEFFNKIGLTIESITPESIRVDLNLFFNKVY